MANNKELEVTFQQIKESVLNTDILIEESRRIIRFMRSAGLETGEREAELKRLETQNNKYKLALEEQGIII